MHYPAWIRTSSNLNDWSRISSHCNLCAFARWQHWCSWKSRYYSAFHDIRFELTLQIFFRYPLSGNINKYSVSVNCSLASNDTEEYIACPLLLTARGGGLPLNFSAGYQQVSLNCSEVKNCMLNFSSPLVERHHYLRVNNIVNSSVKVSILVQTSGECLSI